MQAGSGLHPNARGRVPVESPKPLRGRFQIAVRTLEDLAAWALSLKLSQVPADLAVRTDPAFRHEYRPVVRAQVVQVNQMVVVDLP
jgi:hypothetical protein